MRKSKRFAVLLFTALTMMSSMTTFANEADPSSTSTMTSAQIAIEQIAQSKLPTIGEVVLEAANEAIGVPYRRGGSSMKGFDCSGLVQFLYAQVGVELPHYSGAIKNLGEKVDEPKPGDICWTPGHVAIYVGDGQMIEAPKPGLKVRQVPVRARAYYRVADVDAKFAGLGSEDTAE